MIKFFIDFFPILNLFYLFIYNHRLFFNKLYNACITVLYRMQDLIIFYLPNFSIAQISSCPLHTYFTSIWGYNYVLLECVFIFDERSKFYRIFFRYTLALMSESIIYCIDHLSTFSFTCNFILHIYYFN